MLDKTIPFAGVIMVKHDPKNFPIFPLPQGYTITGWKPGLELSWAQIHCDLGQVNTVEDGVKLFESEFFSKRELLAKQCLFVLDPMGNTAALGSLWDGEDFGKSYPRLHWIACRADCQGKGLVKALISRLLALNTELGGGEFIYLVSQTWSYKALDLYRKFGFSAYKGEKPINWKSENFPEENRLAWDRINQKLSPRPPL